MIIKNCEKSQRVGGDTVGYLPGVEGAPREIGWGVQPASQNLRLFMTKMFDFPYLVHDLTLYSEGISLRLWTEPL